MLADWLGAISPDEFRARLLRGAPAAQPSTTHAARALFDWDVLDRMLGGILAGDPDVLVVARGELLRWPAPRSCAELRAYFSAGAGLCVRRAERRDPGLARVAAAFAELGSAHVQLFVTPGGRYGFGWHYDDEDVFIAQTAGSKDYYFRANTVAAAEPARPAAFARFADERSPLCTATLVAGDFLYLPSRWWHMAMCREDALSISVGVTLRAPPARSAAAPPAG